MIFARMTQDTGVALLTGPDDPVADAAPCPGALRGLLIALAISCACTAAAQEGNAAGEFKSAYSTYQTLVADERYEEAVPHARRALELGLQLYGEHDHNTAGLILNLGTCLRRSGHPAEAVPFLKEAVQRYENTLGENGRELVDPLTELGHALIAERSSRDYYRHYSRALRLIKRHDGSDSLLYADVAMEAGAEMVFRGHDSRGRRYLEQAYRIFSSRPGSDDRRTGTAAFHLGKFHLVFRNFHAAEPLLLEALRIFASRPGDELILVTHAFLVTLYDATEDPESAQRHRLAIGRAAPVTDVEDLQPLVEYEPEYPAAARVGQSEGFVIVEFTVDEAGLIADARTVESEGHPGFEAAALTAISRFRYAPRFVDGQFVATKGVRYRFSFSPQWESERKRCQGIRSAMDAAAKARAIMTRSGVVVTGGPAVYPPYCSR